MLEETQAASSPVEVEDVFKGQNVSLNEMNKYRQDGEVPERFKPAVSESAPDDTPEETDKAEDEDPEPSPDSDPDDKQEPKPKTSEAQKRILQLLAEKKELERKLAEKQDVKRESSTVSGATQSTRTEPTPEDKNSDGTPKYDTYEKYVKDLARWEAEQMLADRDRKDAQKAGAERLNAQVEEGRSRYENLDEVIVPAANEIYNDAAISPVIKQMFADSECLVDLMYTIASNKEEYQRFVKMAKENPGKAIRYVALTESLIAQELEGKQVETSNAVKGAPESRKTNAPKPAATVGGTSSKAFDVSDESLSPEEWARKRTKDLLTRH